MPDFRLRGYVSPEDFTGTDTQKLQQALDTSAGLDIGRVLVQGDYKVDSTLWIRPMTDLVLEGGCIAADGDFPVLANQNLREGEKHSYSFEEKYFTIRGSGRICGDVVLYNAQHVNIDGPEFHGALRFSFTREVRLFNSKFEGEHAVVLAMGTNNFIMQNLTASCTGAAVVMDATREENDYVIGKEPEIHEIILQDSVFHTQAAAITMKADEDSRIYNIQIDHIQSDGASLAIGEAHAQVSDECYFNLTAEALSGDIQVHNPVKHAYLPG